MMRSVIALCWLSAFVLFVGCSSNDASTNPNTPSGVYFPITVGSYWTYKTADSTATRAVISSTTKLGNTYAVVRDYSANDTSYIRRSGSKIYFLAPDSTGTGWMQLQLGDETVGSQTSYDINGFGFHAHIESTTSAVSGNRIVNGKTYSDVIMIRQITSSAFGTDSTDLYLARGVGEIEQMNAGTSVESLSDYKVF